MGSVGAGFDQHVGESFVCVVDLADHDRDRWFVFVCDQRADVLAGGVTLQRLSGRWLLVGSWGRVVLQLDFQFLDELNQ